MLILILLPLPVAQGQSDTCAAWRDEQYYIDFPVSNYLPDGDTTSYADADCQTEPGIYPVYEDGVVYAADQSATADNCSTHTGFVSDAYRWLGGDDRNV